MKTKFKQVYLFGKLIYVHPLMALIVLGMLFDYSCAYLANKIIQIFKKLKPR